MNIIITGYSGSGSSAVIDLLKEFDGVKTSLTDADYEHTLLYYPNSLFDLECKLLHNNDPHRSDEAINTFKKVMDNLYRKNYGWFGSYKNIIGYDFMKIVDKFISKISSCDEDSIWYYRYKTVRFSLLKVILQIAAKLVYNRKVHKWGRQYVIDRKSPSYFSCVTESEFFDSAKEFLSDYFTLCNKTNANVCLYDHLFWPQNIPNATKYLSDNDKIIVVDRDPLDVFLSEKHLWSKNNASGYQTFTHNPTLFSQRWTFIHSNTPKPVSTSQVLYINFEDLIYNYDCTLNKILSFIDNDDLIHINKGKFFDPSKSINNTQISNVYSQDKDCLIIKEALKEYLYAFPFERFGETKNMFL